MNQENGHIEGVYVTETEKETRKWSRRKGNTDKNRNNDF